MARKYKIKTKTRKYRKSSVRKTKRTNKYKFSKKPKKMRKNKMSKKSKKKKNKMSKKSKKKKNKMSKKRKNKIFTFGTRVGNTRLTTSSDGRIGYSYRDPSTRVRANCVIL